MSARRVLVGYLIWIAVLTVVNFVVPAQHVFSWTVLGLSSVAAIVVGAWRNRPRRRAPWLLLAAAVLCLVIGDTTADVLVRWFDDPDPFPSIIDVFYLLMYPLIAAGLWGLYRMGVVRRDAAGLLDALTLTAGIGLLSWIYLINPYVRDPSLSSTEKVISVAYPLADILVLAVGARLIASVRYGASVAMLALGLVGLLFSDVAYGLIQLNGNWHVGTPVDLGWVAFYGLWGAAALHPSMRDLTEPKVLRRDDQRLHRLILLGLASLIAPVVLLIEAVSGEVHDGAVIAVLSVLLSLLVLTRLGRAIVVQRYSADRERGLRRGGAALLLVTDASGVDTVVRDVVARMLPPGRAHRVLLDTHAAAEPEQPEYNSGDNRDGQALSWGHSDEAPDVAMLYASTLDAQTALQLGGFEVVLRCPLDVRDRFDGTDQHGALYIAAEEVTLVNLQEAASVLATQAALALERIALSDEIDRRNSESYFRTLVLNTADVILVIDEADRIQYASPSAAKLFMRAEVTGIRLADLVDQDSLADVERRLVRVREGYTDHHDRDWLVRRAGDRRARVEVSCRDLRDEPTIHSLVITMRDVTESRRLEAELYQRATYDSLTALPNRAVLLESAQRAIERACVAGATVGVIVVELDDFKVVNNTMGHEAGDELLRAVGERLHEVVRTFDRPQPDDETWPKRALARLGGDEFAVLVWCTPGGADADRAVERIVDVFEEPFVLSQGVFPVGASVGVATTTEAVDAQELLRHADLAVYVAKDAGKGRSVRYESSLHTAVVDRLKLRSDLERAVTEGGFLLHYQPIVALESGRTVGFEALVRWNHPTRGLLSPQEFIGVAEESGLIVPLGSWILREAVEAAVRWQVARPDESVYVSVNVSARQFRTPGFVEQVRAELARTGLPYHCLTLELTESILLWEGGEVSKELNPLRRDGMRVAIDDFGTGFSSLSYLRQLSVDILKVDKSFVDTIVASSDQHAVVSAIVQLARTLRLGVIAEGIETHEELDQLIAMGCEFGQGYLLSRPMSYPDTLHWMVDDNMPPVGTITVT